MRIQLSKGMILYVIMVVICIFPILITNTAIGYLPLIALICAGVVSFLQLFFVRRGLLIDTASSSGIRYREESSSFVLHVENGSFLPVPNFRATFFIRSLAGTDMREFPLNLTMSPKEKRDFNLEADFTHIGLYEAGLQNVMIFDLFNIVKVECPVYGETRVEVLPKTHKLDKLPISDKTYNESAQAVTASVLNGMDYTGVREYEFGDPLKRIQWKLSAHTNIMMTKLMESYTNVGMSVVMDLRVPEHFDEDLRHELLDGVIECAAAVCVFAHKSGLDCELFYNGENGKHKEYPIHADDFLPFLQDLHLHAERRDLGPIDILRDDCVMPHSQSNVILCTSQPDEEIVSTLISLRQRGKNAIMLYMIPKNISDAERAELLAPLHLMQNANISVIAAESAEGMVKQA